MHSWLAGRADPDRHIYPTLTAKMEQGYGERAQSMKYFTGAVMEAVTDDQMEVPASHRRAAGNSSGSPTAHPGKVQQATRLERWHAAEAKERGSGFWLPEWGDPPPAEG